jgi:large repetitive protein
MRILFTKILVCCFALLSLTTTARSGNTEVINSRSNSVVTSLVITGFVNGTMVMANRIDDCSGSTISLVVTDNTGAPINDPSITWYHEGMYQPSFQGLSMITPPASGKYTVTANLPGSGSVSSQTYIVTQISPGNPVYILFYSGSPCTTLEMGDFWNSYQWYLGNTLITGATAHTYTATTSGVYYCAVTNACGGTLSVGSNVSVSNAIPLVTAANGGVLCGSSVTLTTQAGLSGVYQWQKSTTSASGPFTLIVNSNSPSYNATSVGWYRCTLTTNCGAQTSTAVAVTQGAAVPLSPGTITGNKKPCPVTSVTYSFSPVANATQYTWTYPAGVSGPATTTLPSASVAFASNFVNGHILISAKNQCGTSVAKSVYVSSAKPGTPGVISGQNTGLCNGANASFTISAVANATSYNWSVPAGVTINSGQGTTSINVTFPSLFNRDTIKVNATNSCATSAYRTFVVSGKPKQPASISGAISVCANQTQVPYSTSSVLGATSYLWTLPAGAVISSGQNTNSIHANFATTAGNVAVKAKNACGTSAAFNLAVAMPCRVGESEEADIAISPNPFSEATNIHLSGWNNGAHLDVFDITGKVLISKEVESSEAELTIGVGFDPGIYLIRIADTENQKVIRIVKGQEVK